MNKLLLVILLLIIVIFQVEGITQPKRGTDDDPSMVPPELITQSFSGLDYEMKMIYNTKGLFLQEEADAIGIDSSDAAGVLKTESSGNGFQDFRMIIRFENHIFYKYYTDSGQIADRVVIFDEHFYMDPSSHWKDHKFRECVTCPWISFHGNQDKEWMVLQFAQGLDDTDGLLSASYGAAQIMGFNFQSCEYNNVQSFFVDLSSSIHSQLTALFSFIVHNDDCYEALRKNPTDYVGFASCYNGSGQASVYGNNIKLASEAYDKVTSTIDSLPSDDPIPEEPENGIFTFGDVVIFKTISNVRMSPTISGIVLTKSEINQQAIILDEQSVIADGYTWYPMQLLDSYIYIGWVAYSQAWYKLDVALYPGDTVIFNTATHLRQEPSLDYQNIMKTIQKGEYAEITYYPVIEDGFIWYGMKQNDQVGWAALGDNFYSRI